VKAEREKTIDLALQVEEQKELAKLQRKRLNFSRTNASFMARIKKPQNELEAIEYWKQKVQFNYFKTWKR
jgi:hypothetical protein